MYKGSESNLGREVIYPVIYVHVYKKPPKHREITCVVYISAYRTNSKGIWR